MNGLIMFLLICWPAVSSAQLIFDRGHFTAVNQNGVSREAAETIQGNYLNNIHDRLSDINLGISSVVLVQRMIETSMSQVDEALKSGLAFKQIVQLSAELITECDHMISTARSDPVLLLFASDVSHQMKDRGMKLVTEVADFILKEGSGVLMDFEKRDALLRKIILDLKLMRALAYGMERSMYWSRQNGLWKTADPFAGFINQDSQMINDILLNAHLLK